VHRKDQGWSMGLVYDPMKLPGVTTARPGIAGVLQLPASSLMPPLPTMASWWHYFCLFLQTLASSSTPWTTVLGDASLPLLSADRNSAALAWWVAMAHHSPMTLFGALSDAWRGCNGVPLSATSGRPCQRPLGSQLDLIHPPSSS
jgi:hypothetical protein